MKKAMQKWSDFSFEEPKKASFLTLPNSIMEHICRYLDTRTKYKVCYIHSKWATAAQNVLWEKPCLDQPKNFGLFLTAINESKKNALLVRNIFLIFTDHTMTLFQPIAKSNKERHCPNNLANPNIATTITRICEKVTTLTIYGWELETMHIERLASLAQDLTSLYIVGAKVGHELALNSVFSRLTSLRLDGNFNISLKWAETLITRATRLTELQLSLQNMDIGVLAKICTPQKLNLSHLTFTDAFKLRDHYILKIVEAFPGLVEFHVEGATHLTAVSIVYALNCCVNLNCLEIRSHPESLRYIPDEDNLALFNDNIQTGAYPSRLLIENLNLSDDQLICLSPYLSFIQTLGFKDCSLLTSDGIQLALSENRYLHIFQVINCPNIDSSILTGFSYMDYLSSSIYRIHFESSGSINPKDIYNICYRGSSHNLREIRFVAYNQLQETIINSFDTSSEMDRYVNDKPIITLNSIAIDSIAHSTDPQLCPVVEGRFISSQMISLLAKHFEMKPFEFVNLINELEKESKQMNEPISKIVNRPVNRLSALKAESSTFRSTTPALWSKEFKPTDIPDIYGLNNRSENTLNVTEEYHTSDAQEDEDDDDEEEDEEEEEEKEEDEEEREREEQEQGRLSSLGHDSMNESNTSLGSTGHVGSEINLGGWGATPLDEWNTHSKNRRDSPSLKSPKKDWKEYKEGGYQEEWQQTSFTPSKGTLFQRDNKKHYRNSPIVAESDGWGPINEDTVVSYFDLEKQGFVKERIDEQKNTSYWVEDKYVIGTEQEKPDRPAVPASGANTPSLTTSPPIPFSFFKSNTNPRYSPSSKANYDRRSRSDSLVSSDSSVSWNNSSDSVIKLSGKESTTTKFSVSKKPKVEQSGQHQWSSQEDWNKAKESKSFIATPTPTTAHAKHGSWQDNFSSDVTKDKNAKSDWSNVASASAVTPRRSTFSRPPTASATVKSTRTESSVFDWEKFANNPKSAPNTQSTTPVATSSESVSLIDTTNSPSLSDRPALKGDLWESIGTLSMPTSNVYSANSSKVLVPQEAPRSKPIEVSLWKEDNTKNESFSSIHFTNVISGTVSTAEIDLQNQTSKADNPIDFEDLVPLSNLPFVQPISPVAPAAPAVPTVTPTIPPTVPLTANPTVTPTVPTVAPTVPATTATVTPTVPPATATATPTVPPTTATASSYPEEKEGSGSETEKKSIKPIKLRVKRSDDSLVNLSIYDGDDIEAVVASFCKEHDLDYCRDNLYKQAVEKMTKKKTKSILRIKEKKSKKVFK